MGSHLNNNGETASLRKRKREQKDDAQPHLKRHRIRSRSKHQSHNALVHVNGVNGDRAQDDSASSQNYNRELRLPSDLQLESAKDGRVTKPQWKLSEPMGGRMLDIDPMFSEDER